MNLQENQIMINKAQKKISEGINIEFWEKELDTLMNERVMIKNGDNSI